MEHSTFRIGQEVGDFLIIKPLGGGGMADLYLAKDRLLGRKVVIKVLSPLLTRRKDFRSRFIREAKIQAGLDNPHIVQIYGLIMWGESPCLVMQHVRGTDLERVITTAKGLKEKCGGRGALSVGRAVHIFLQVLEGVGFAHRYRIVHGDIKPSNILLDRQGRAKVADFGLAEFTRRQETGSGTGGAFQGGSPHYMSPEQILHSRADLRSDIYALGVTLFHMITGRFPHGEKKTATDLMEWHMEGSLEEPKAIMAESGDVPASLQSAILGSLESDPDRRPQSCLELSLAVREECTQETYTELLRTSLLTKSEIIPSERAYLDWIARKRSLSLEEAHALEARVRKEMGLPPVDFAVEYRSGLEGPFPLRQPLDSLYVLTGRLTEEQVLQIKSRRG